jgi:hypothetical protein
MRGDKNWAEVSVFILSSSAATTSVWTEACEGQEVE